MSNNRISGIIYFKVNGEQIRAAGSFSFGLGKHQREAVVGHDGVHGFKEIPTIPFIEGETTFDVDLDLDRLAEMDDVTVTLELSNGKTVVLRNAWFVNKDGLTGSTEEGKIPVRFEGKSAEIT